MKKQNLAACFSVITLVFTMFGCKIESNSETKYEEKVYVSAVNFEAESSADDSRIACKLDSVFIVGWSRLRRFPVVAHPEGF